jgi:hypothetical protein
MNISKIKRSSQSIDNFSFDEEYLQSAVEVLVENTEGTALVRQKAIATEAKQDELIGNKALRLAESGNYTYIGKAEIGASPSSAVWQIKRIDETSGLVISWADGDDIYDNVWDNYLTLSYD